MKKTVSTIIAGLALSTGFSSEIAAQYHSYTPREPSIIIDMSVLDEAGQQPKKYDPKTHATVPRATPVTQVPLSWTKSGADSTEEKSEDLPAPIVSEQPSAAKKRILKPTFARSIPQTPEEVEESAEEETVDDVQEQVEKDTPATSPVPLPRPETIQPEIKRPTFARPVIEQPQTTVEDTPLAASQEEPPVEEVQVSEVAPAAPSVDNMPAVPTLSDLTLVFSQAQNDLDPAMQQKLDSIALHLASTIDSRLQVRAYAMGEDGTKASARRISLSRALAVRSYLMDKGVRPVRVDVRALGTDTDREPIDRVDLVFAK